MKLPINSLKEFGLENLDFEKVLNIVSTKIGSVEGYSKLSDAYEGVVIVEIVLKDIHPNADKLAVYKISTGEQEIQVVAGDKTLEIGDKVAYRIPGNIVPYTYGSAQPIKIRAANMRGVTSNGMMCSEKELNIGPNHEKVLVLDSQAQVGISFSDYYDFNDVVIDIENKALTNRGDLFGILGLARELATALNMPFKSPSWYIGEQDSFKADNISSPVKVENKAGNLCPRYMCVSMDNINVSQSPVWLKSILLKSGIRPINNIVDITNYISLITGQPLHAFDYDKLIENDLNIKDIAHITVRVAQQGEKIQTLDGNVVELSDNNLVIADSTNPIAIAGVIGGKDTEIDIDSKRIILECANFNKYSIRKTSMELGIFTEAVTRFTKGQTPNLCPNILVRATQLIKEISGAQISSEIVDIYPQQETEKNITLSIPKLNTILGTTLSKNVVKDILNTLEYKILSEDIEYITVIPPLFRTDIYIPEDIFEDIGRIYGYENILPRLPQRDIKAVKVNRNINLKKKIRTVLSNSGCNELETYSFTSQINIENAKQDLNQSFHIKNSLSPDLEYMRTSLLVSLLEKGKYNIQKNISPFCIYEFNIPHQKEYLDNFKLPKEDWHLGLLFTSKEDIFDGSSYYQVKQYLEKVFRSLRISNIEYTLISQSSQIDLPVWIKYILPTFNPYQSALIKTFKDGKEIILGVIGDIEGDVKNSFKLPQYTCALEINLEEISKLEVRKSMNISESKFPAITQDICITLNSNVKYIDLENLVLKIINSKERSGTVECIDIYQKDPQSKNITLRVSIEHKEKTLTDKEYSEIKDRIEEKVKSLTA
ncbi:MAG: phenylalanine--tRNA ligase subunit beta [Candidatus Dojkabacteria bacterium]|nr:phenylalanine--tRNA ligase subunit beta [Candidatus Dojkabacteria bacterium]